MQERAQASGRFVPAGWSLRDLAEGTKTAEVREVIQEHGKLTELANSLTQHIRAWEAAESGAAEDAAPEGEFQVSLVPVILLFYGKGTAGQNPLRSIAPYPRSMFHFQGPS